MPLPTPTARSPLVVCSVLKCCRQCRWPLSSCSHHWPAYLPNAGIERGGEHGSFMRGDEASPSMKGCSLCMYLRCVRATRASARDICSTLPARRVDLSRFTRAVVACTHVPAVLQRFTRFASGFDGSLETTRAQGPILSARSYDDAPRIWTDTRMNVETASRCSQKSSYRSPYLG